PPPGPEPSKPPTKSPPAPKPTRSSPAPSTGPTDGEDSTARYDKPGRDTNSADGPSGPSLPVTGSAVAPIVGIGATALVAGIGLVAAGRRRRTD
ncbi:cell wall anchor protein, partial [Micromonospora inaquosa]